MAARALAVPEGMTRVSYSALAAPRAAVQNRMQKTYEAAVFDPEAFRTMLAQMKPEEAGLNAGGDEVLNRFQLSLLTEGSGTQVFATTFVQWAAREALRRAQPLTLVARFAPRQREKQMNELLAERQRPPELDPRRFADRRRYGRLLHVAQSAAPSRARRSRHFWRGLKITARRWPSRPRSNGANVPTARSTWPI